MALTGVLRAGFVQIRVLEMDEALAHYVDRIGLDLVEKADDGRVYLAGLLHGDAGPAGAEAKAKAEA